MNYGCQEDKGSSVNAVAPYRYGKAAKAVGFQSGSFVRLLQRDWVFTDLFFRDLAIVGYWNEYLLIQLLSFKF